MGFLDSQFNILPLCCLGSQMAFILNGFSINKPNALLSWDLCCLATLWQPPWGMQLRQMNRLANEWGLGFQYSLARELCISPAQKWNLRDSLIIKIKQHYYVCLPGWSQDTCNLWQIAQIEKQAWNTTYYSHIYLSKGKKRTQAIAWIFEAKLFPEVAKHVSQNNIPNKSLI